MWYQGLRVQVPSIAPSAGIAALKPGRKRKPHMQLGYGILLPLGLFVGLAIGLALGQPSAGAVIGFFAGAALGLVLTLRKPRA